MKYKLLILLLVLTYSCTKEKEYAQEEKFQEMLDNLVLDCPDEISDYYFQATINGTEACYMDGIYGLSKKITFGPIIITSGSSINTTTDITILGNKINFGILPASSPSQYQNWIQIETPIFDINVTKEEYLDSLFAQPFHNLMDRNNPQGLNVSLKIFDVSVSGVGGLSYPISSKFGYQHEDDFIHFTKVEKTNEGNDIYYDVEMEIQAGLYFFKNKDGFTQYGKEGLWGRLDDGLLKMKVKL